MVELMDGTQSRHFTLAVALAAGFGAALLTAGIIWMVNRADAKSMSALYPGAASSSFADSCNVLDLQIYGGIVGTAADVPTSDTIPSSDGSGMLLTPNYTTASAVRYALDTAAANPNIKAILLDIDSTGGTGAAGEEIAKAVRGFGKPTVAVIHTSGLSAAYLIAAASERVYALEGSIVGSIGTTLSFLNQAEKNKKEGIKFEQLSSGPYKDMFSPDKPLTEAERALIQREVTLATDLFIRLVSEYRHLSADKVKSLADGSAVLGQEALENGLIDTIGTRADAVKYIEEKIGEPMVPCWN